MLWQIVSIGSFTICCLLAVFWGGRTERAAAAILYAALFLTWIALNYSGTLYASAELGVLMVDAAVLVGLVGLALFSDKFWPLWAAGFHLVGVVTHVAVMADQAIAPLAYAHALGIWSYLILLTLLLGTLAHHKQVKAQDVRSY